MLLSNPVQITPRLLPGVQVGGAWLSIAYGEWTGDGRQGYVWHIDIGRKSYSGSDLASGVGGGGLQQGLESLVSFLGACGESYRHYGKDGENANLFSLPVAKWAAENSDELAMMGYYLEEGGETIQE